VGRNDIVGRGKDIGVVVAVGMARCVSAKAVLTVDMAVFMISASLSVGVDWALLQEASIMVTRNKRTRVLPKMFIFHFL
jgi:hypothetical protein